MNKTIVTLTRFCSVTMMMFMGFSSYAQSYNALELLADQSLHKDVIFEKLRSDAPLECPEFGE